MAPQIIVVGSANMDFVFHVEALPRAGETLRGSDLALFPGGKGANQACAAGRLGGRVAMVAQMGRDAFGAELVESLRQSGVRTDGVGMAGRPTGCASIYVLPDGNNSIVISPGANAGLDPVSAVSRLGPLRPADIVLLQLEVPLETVEAVLRAAKAAGATTILDPAPARALPASILECVDVLTPNQTEAATLLGRPDAEPRDVAEAATVAAALRRMGPRCVVLKLGELGCFLADDDGNGHIPGFPVSPVDTTAAGDVFNGAFAVALAEGRQARAAARIANAAAALSVTRRGAQSSTPTRDEVNALLAGAVETAGGT